MANEVRILTEAEVAAELNTTKQRMEKLAIESGYLGSQIAVKKLALSTQGISYK